MELANAPAAADLIRHHPEQIGWLDGIPAQDRDQANRLVLDRARAEARHEVDRLRAEADHGGGVSGWIQDNITDRNADDRLHSAEARLLGRGGVPGARRPARGGH